MLNSKILTPLLVLAMGLFSIPVSGQMTNSDKSMFDASSEHGWNDTWDSRSSDSDSDSDSGDDSDSDSDSDSDNDFSRRPDFRAVLTPVETGNPNTAGFSAIARFWLSDDEDRLKYSIRIAGMDVIGFMGPGNPSTNDVTKIHLHSDSIFDKHVLNVYKAPSQDDADLVVRPAQGTLRGSWDDDDETINPMNPEGGSTLTLSSQLENLCADNLWIVIHGSADIVENPGIYADRVLGGQLVKRPRSNACEQ